MNPFEPSVLQPTNPFALPASTSRPVDPRTNVQAHGHSSTTWPPASVSWATSGGQQCTRQQLHAPLLTRQPSATGWQMGAPSSGPSVGWPAQQVTDPWTSSSGPRQDVSWASWPTQPSQCSPGAWPGNSSRQQDVSSTPWPTEPWPSSDGAWAGTDMQRKGHNDSASVPAHAFGRELLHSSIGTTWPGNSDAEERGEKHRHKHRHKHHTSYTETQPCGSGQAVPSPWPAHEFGRELLRSGLSGKGGDRFGDNRLAEKLGLKEGGDRQWKGVLIRVISARDLHNVEVFGRRMDPYVEATLGECRAKTSVSNGHKAPFWNEDLRLPLGSSNRFGEHITFSVFDKNIVMGDALIGSGSILYIASEQGRGMGERTLTLQRPNGNDAGTLEISLQLLDERPSFHEYTTVSHQSHQSHQNSQSHNDDNHNNDYHHDDSGGGGGDGGDPMVALAVLGAGAAVAGIGFAAVKAKDAWKKRRDSR